MDRLAASPCILNGSLKHGARSLGRKHNGINYPAMLGLVSFFALIYHCYLCLLVWIDLGLH